MTDDLISRRAAIDAIRKGYPDVINSEYKDGLRIGTDRAIYHVEKLSPAQPENKEIDYQDCSNAMLKMWIDNVVTDGEYNRIMDKLNAHWGKKDGRFNQQTGGDSDRRADV